MASVLHSTGEVASSQLKSELSPFNRIDNASFEGLNNTVFDFLITSKDPDILVGKLQDLSSEVGLSLGALKIGVRTELAILKAAGKHGTTAKNLQEDFELLGLQPEKAGLISEKWTSNYLAICRSMVGQTFMINQLLDMEWKFGVTAASSEMKKVGNSFLQLKLVVSKGSDSMEEIFMEMSLQQFYTFLHEMERAKANLDLLE
eukprot:gene17465-19212_t